MDVDKLQRITSLASEFMRHGMATTMDEAVSMAEQQIYGEKPVTEIKEGLQQQSVVLNDNSAQHIMVNKLQRVTQVQARDIQAMQSKMNEMIQVINTLETELKRVRQQPMAAQAQQVLREAPPQQAEQSAEPASPPPTAVATAPPQQESQGHARSGTFTSDDVSIEKMFYFGVR